jgi:para-aminobenzoate synthetase component 1
MAAYAPPPPPKTSACLAERLRSNFTRAGYMDAVAQAIEYIAAGDIFQVNLSQRLTADLNVTAAELYAGIQATYPACYAALLDYDDHSLVCNSPELFIRVDRDEDGRRQIMTRPIKGTRPRGAGMEEQLRHSIKDQAELNMIVDLERNDLGRICEIGSVRVSQTRTIEAHPTVLHGAATVEGTLRPEVDLVGLLAAVFPGGSITGAPKIRAMQIIEELERTRRGPYCGAIGYFESTGRIELNIAIRTMSVQDGRVHVPVGGGIVADSDPREEYEETIVKAQAALRVLGLDQRVSSLP